MPFFDPIRIGASGAADTTFTVDRSLRFNDDDNAYLERTPSSASNRTTFTLSVWLKRSGNLDNHQRILEVGTGTGHRTFFIFDGDDKLQINHVDSGSQAVNLTTTAKFRDISAWYHIVLAIDTTQGSSSDRIKIYVNGTQQTAFDTSTYPTSNKEFDINSTAVHYFGRSVNNTGKFDGYMAEINLIDGSQLTPASFGETNPVTGQWNPKKYTGSYGTNGFYLNFSDNSGTTATTLGKDSSGNGNNFTPNNFSVSAGAGNDSLEDTPTNNFCTMNPLVPSPSVTWANGNLDLGGSSSSEYNQTNTSTFGVSSGKWYAEVKYTNDVTTNTYVGICPITTSATTNLTNNVTDGAVLRMDNTLFIEGSSPSSGTSISSGDTIGIALDMDNQKVWFSVQGTYLSSGNPATGAKALCSANLPDPTILLPNQHFNTVLYSGDGNATKSITGVGFKPDWLWLKGRNTSYSHLLYNAVVGAGLEKGLNSNEDRAEGSVVGDNSTFGYLNSFDSDGFSVTKGSDSTSYTNGGSSNYVAWNWNAGDTDGKTYTVTVVDSGGNKFRFDGFATNAVTLDLAEGGTYIFNYPSGHPFRFSTTSDGTHGGGSEYTTGVTHNSSTQVTIVVAASAPTLYYYCSSHSGMGGQVNTNSTLGSSNFDGTIQSTVKVNASAGFSIVSFTGNATSGATVGHGLGVAPRSFILKERGNTNNWPVYHAEIGNTKVLYLDLNNDSGGAFTGAWNNTSPTSNVFYLGNSNETNRSSGNFIVYCFSEVAGFSKFGTFTGNGNADGTFVYTGFKPAMLIMKASSGTSNWTILDNKRDPHNVTTNRLQPNLSNAEDTPVPVDFLSNGFKHRSTNLNSSGDTHIYMAFAESPFKYARAR